MIELHDLPLFWDGRAQALQALVNARKPGTSEATERQAETYANCAKELRAALSTPPHSQEEKDS